MALRLLLLFTCIIFLRGEVRAQNTTILNNSPSMEIKDYWVLPDSNYTFRTVQNTSQSAFSPDSLSTKKSDAYWIKLTIKNPYPNVESYFISLPPALNFICLSRNPDDHKWIICSAGLNSRRQVRLTNVVPIRLAAQKNSVVYLKIDLRELRKYNHVFKPAIHLEKAIVFESREMFLTLFFYVCCVALVSFASYNLYLYFNLKDGAYLYYVIVQCGALLFFVGDNLYFNVLSPIRVYDVLVVKGELRSYYIDFFFEHIGVAILFWGFVQFTRSYLNTSIALPKCDTFLKILAKVYVGLEFVPAILNLTGLYYLDMAIAVNSYILVIIVSCIGTALIAFRHKVIGAKYFLMANLLPAIFAIAASMHILIYSTSSPIFPTMAILSQIFTFAVAMVARITLINQDLNRQASEAMQLKMDMSTANYERLLIEQQHAHLAANMSLEQEKNELLKLQLEANQRELVGSSVHLHQKSKLLADLKTQLQGMDTSSLSDKSEVLRSMKSSLKDDQYLDGKWNDFKLHFEKLHPGFFSHLLASHPSLTTYELRLCAYFHINLSTKEIAALLNIAPASVRQAKTRLHKKMRTV